MVVHSSRNPAIHFALGAGGILTVGGVLLAGILPNYFRFRRNVAKSSENVTEIRGLERLLEFCQKRQAILHNSNESQLPFSENKS